MVEYIGLDLGHQLSIFVNADFFISRVVYAFKLLINVIVLGS